ncbi:MAG: sporulation integral membrane protein YtvI [Clostridia bacterium]|nr:sporulation integral membrane protein YtvI [Clostridia bacterium]
MEKYKKITFIGISVAILVLIGYLFLKYALDIFLPFIIAFLIVAMARPIINKIANHTKISKPIVSIFVLSMLLVFSALVLGVILTITIEQVGNIAEGIIEGLSREENFVLVIFNSIDKLTERLPFLNNLLGSEQSIYNLVIEMLLDGAKSLSARLTNYLAKMITALPSIVVTLIVFTLALFYFAKDYDKIGNRIIKLLPKRAGNIALIFKNDVLLVVSKYLKSYLILLLITFAELISGFLILGIDNSFVLALIIAIVDMLPILGAGTVLVPWSAIMLILGNYKLAIGLFVLAGITYFSRQFLEPKILSDQMNVHPLITLLFMYAGLKIAGFIGLIVAPVVAFIIKITLSRMKNEKNVEKVEDL